MQVTIIRRASVRGILGALTIKINGKKVGKIRSEQHVVIPIPTDPIQLEVSQFGSRSNVLEISNGETIEIKNSKFSTLIYVLIIFMPTLIAFLPSSQYRMVSTIIYIIFVLLINFMTNMYQIRKI